MKRADARSGRSAALLPAALILAAAGLVPPLQDRLDVRLGARAPDPDLLYFSSPGAVRRLALGYGSLAADVYWMRAIQYYGRREEAARRPVRYKNLASLLDIATTLDPDLLDAYRAGSAFLAEPEPAGAGQPGEALRLLDKGIARHPLDWRLRFDKGFIHYIHLSDFRAAGETWLEAGRLSTSPPWMPGLAAAALSKGGAIETAKALWRHQLTESDRADVKENARGHLESLAVHEDLWTLEFLLEQYVQKTGRRAARLEDLPAAGLAGSLPADPSGTPYGYDAARGTVSLGAASRVRLLKVPESYRGEVRSRLAAALPGPR